MEQIADTIGVISEGKLIKEVSMDEIHEENTEYIELVVNDMKKAFYVLDEILHLTNFKVVGESRFRIYDTGTTQSEISKTLILNGVMIEEINKKNHSLEDYFLTLINGGGISA